MVKREVKKFAAFILLISLNMGLCSCSIPRAKPKEGIWYCQELMIEIDFFTFNQQNTAFCAKKYDSDGTYQDVQCLFDYGDNIQISSLDWSECYLLGDFVYRNDTFVVKSLLEDKRTYVFERIDD